MLSSLILKLQSTRKFADKEIPDQDLEYILDIGKLEASKVSHDTVMIGIINDSKLISELTGCCHGSRFIERAPIVCALCTRRMDDEYLDMEKYRLGKLKEELYDIDSNVLDIICAREHAAFSAAEMMALAACERGISSYIERYFDVYKASRILRVPNSHLVTYLIALGYSNETSGEMSSDIESSPIFYNIFDK